MMYRILIIEDEKPLARFLQLELGHEGYLVTLAHDGPGGLSLALEHEFDMILIDWMLPGMEGIEVCKKLRESKQIPILMLTARGMISERVNGLDAGADDYVVKPFAIEELIARIRAIQRRQADRSSDTYKLQDLVLDPVAHRVEREGQQIDLSVREYDLLKYFLENKGVVQTRESLLRHVWGFSFAGETNVVDVYIRYLRAKIDDSFETKLIHTVRGVGYVLRGSE
ncbi:DNA-binding response regulator [Paenibacillus contaminans]|uniref:DNA-binding response regulator n=2 Tax=Paenibacillus contaminans TaxID=450362 RepID=A0A329MJM3_9BACL|nr:DNA-binding response regulator [Paenibacillus contaminans]